MLEELGSCPWRQRVPGSYDKWTHSYLVQGRQGVALQKVGQVKKEQWNSVYSEQFVELKLRLALEVMTGGGFYIDTLKTLPERMEGKSYSCKNIIHV